MKPTLRHFAVLVLLAGCFPLACQAQDLTGIWKVEGGRKGNHPISKDKARAMEVRITGDMFTLLEADRPVLQASWSVRKPGEFDLRSAQGVAAGIYKLTGNELLLCWDNKDGRRPKDFSGENDDGSLILLELSR